MRNERKINLANCNLNFQNKNSPNTNEVKTISPNLKVNLQPVNQASGITLIALVVTIVVLLILAGVSISTVLGNNGIIPRANEAKFKTELASIQEEFTLYVTDKTIENSDFSVGTLNASSNLLTYNTQPEEEKGTGNINTVLKSSTAQKYMQSKSFSIIKGDLIYASQNAKELQWAQEVGLAINPYSIDENGVLLSSETNLMLMDKSTGTLVIPDMVTAIGAGAFTNVQTLKKIIIPGSVKIIHDDAFSYNNDIEEVIMLDGVERIGHRAFTNCSNLKKLTMPDSVSSIGKRAFRNDVQLASPLKMPSSLRTIPLGAFDGCQALEDVNLNNVEEICDRAFAGCESLYNIELTKSVNTISPSAFRSCSNLNLSVSPDNDSFVKKNGFILSKDEKKITFVTQEAIKNNTLVIPNTIITLGHISYQHLSGIKVIEIPNSVTDIEADFLRNRIGNIEIKIQEGNEKYITKNNAVYSKDGTILHTYFKDATSIVIPEGVTTISEGAFSGLGSLTNVSLPQSLERIEQNVFANCNNIYSFHLGRNVRDIHPRVDGFSSINEVTIDKHNPNFTIENNIIFNKEKTVVVRLVNGSYQDVTIPTGVVETKYCAFYGNTIKTLNLPNTLKKLDGLQFVLGLTKAEIPSNVTEIAGMCFSECSDLQEIIIHKSKGSIAGQPWSCPYGDRIIKWMPSGRKKN